MDYSDQQARLSAALDVLEADLRRAAWKYATYSKADALRVAGITAGQLKGIEDRGQVWLSGGHNPGRGRPRVYAGRDILALTVARYASQLGFPLRFLNLLVDQFVSRADDRCATVHLEPRPMVLAVYPLSGGPEADWASIEIVDDVPARPLPPAFVIFALDQIIDEVIAGLASLGDAEKSSGGEP